MEQSEIDPDSRFKPLLATVRGPGGGKTRALEEIRFSLLEKQGVLPLAITFNSTMNIVDGEYKPGTRAICCYARSIVTRLAAVFYGLPVSSVRRMLNVHIPLWGSEPEDATDLIRGFLLHAFKKAPKGTNTIVILADEVAKAETHFSLASNSGSNKALDYTTALRQAVLDERIAPGLDAALVISSLTISPIGETSSGREVEPLVLLNLDHDKVVKGWWNKSEPKDCVALSPLAAALCALPRLEEMAAELLKEHDEPVTRDFIVDLINKLTFRIEARYKPGMLSREELRAVVFREEINLDNTAMDRIEDSLYTNSLVNFKQNRRLKIVPEASLILLAAGAQSTNEHSVLLKEFLHDLQLKDEGDMLEWCTHWWLKMRLAVILGEQGFSLAKFLGLDKSGLKGSRTQFAKVNAIHFNLPGPSSLAYIVTHEELVNNNLTSSHDDQQSFFGDLGKIELAPGEVRLFQSPKNERFDHLLAVCGQDGPFLVFIENKSRIVQEEGPSAGKEAKRLGLQQADYVHGLANAASKMRRLTGLARALGRKQYSFLYITSHEGESEGLDNAVVLRAVDAEKFFGPLWGFYRAVRAGVKD